MIRIIATNSNREKSNEMINKLIPVNIVIITTEINSTAIKQFFTGLIESKANKKPMQATTSCTNL